MFKSCYLSKQKTEGTADKGLSLLNEAKGLDLLSPCDQFSNRPLLGTKECQCVPLTPVCVWLLFKTSLYKWTVLFICSISTAAFGWMWFTYIYEDLMCIKWNINAAVILRPFFSGPPRYCGLTPLAPPSSFHSPLSLSLPVSQAVFTQHSHTPSSPHTTLDWCVSAETHRNAGIGTEYVDWLLCVRVCVHSIIERERVIFWKWTLFGQ